MVIDRNDSLKQRLTVSATAQTSLFCITAVYTIGAFGNSEFYSENLSQDDFCEVPAINGLLLCMGLAEEPSAVKVEKLRKI